MLDHLKRDLDKLKNPAKAKFLARFFKISKGEYAEGDIFLGIIVPKQRQVAKQYADLSLNDLQALITSKIHEYRLVALLILVGQYAKGSKDLAKTIVNFYLSNTKNINSWDLVDLSAENILGEYFLDKNKRQIYDLAKSDNLWERRIAVLTTFQFIKNQRFTDALAIYKLLLKDKHDLIQKAVGWMLREIGKRDLDVELKFLDKYYQQMPRTMLRYAIERFEPNKKAFYMKKTNSK